MAECKDVDKALANLARKIDEQSACCNANKSKLAELDGRIRRLEGSSGQREKVDLTSIQKRLDAIELYINLFDSSCKSAVGTIQGLRNIFRF